VLPHRNFEIFGFWGNLWTHGSTHRLAMDMGSAANERARQTVYSIRRWNFFKGFLVTSVQGEFSHRNFEIFGFGGTICTHGTSHRADRDMGVGAY
jgi:hypothetical protein